MAYETSILGRNQGRDQRLSALGAPKRATVAEHDGPHADHPSATGPAVDRARAIRARRAGVSPHAIDVVEGDGIGRLFAHSALPGRHLGGHGSAAPGTLSYPRRSAPRVVSPLVAGATLPVPGRLAGAADAAPLRDTKGHEGRPRARSAEPICRTITAAHGLSVAAPGRTPESRYHRARVPGAVAGWSGSDRAF
jgi:hypothetical protein